MAEEDLQAEYYLIVVPEGEVPEFPRPENELLVGSQSLVEGYIQYWAYPKTSGKDAQDLPLAETLAQEYHSSKPSLLVHQPSLKEGREEELVELILVKDGHAWAKTESNLDNLEDNVASILEFATKSFNIRIEHFMTTDKVSKEVESKLDELEETEVPEEEKKPVEHRQFRSIRSSTSNQLPSSGVYSSASSSSPWLQILPGILLIGVFAAGLFIFRDTILSKLGIQLGNQTQNEESTTSENITPTPKATPTPTAVNREDYKIRVLNGTSKSGAAATLAESLKKLGWNVSKTGNATSSAVAQTQVRVKEGTDELAQTLVKDLSADFEASISSSLSENDTVDAEVVIGKK